MSESLSRPIVISIGLHVAVVAAIFFQAVLIPSEPLDLRSAIRVDVVDLPKKMDALPEPTSQPAPAPAPPTPKELPHKVETQPAPTPVTPKVPNLKSPKANLAKAQNHALEKIKAMSALDKIKQEVGQEKSNKAKAEVVRGNKVSAGNSLTGLEKLDFDRYFDELKVKVNSNLSVPQWLADADLRAQVLVLIDERGFVIKRVIKKSSNNEVFDGKVLEAIDASSPLPAPPARLRGLLSTSGITFNFPQ